MTMTVVSSDILVRGRDLVQDLRSEGRKVDAQTVDALLRALEDNGAKALYLTTGQVARRIGVSRQTIVNWVQQGIVPGVRLGGRTMIPASVFDRFKGIEQILDELDAERPPGQPEEVAEAVHRGREGRTFHRSVDL